MKSLTNKAIERIVKTADIDIFDYAPLSKSDVKAFTRQFLRRAVLLRLPLIAASAFFVFCLMDGFTFRDWGVPLTGTVVFTTITWAGYVWTKIYMRYRPMLRCDELILSNFYELASQINDPEFKAKMSTYINHPNFTGRSGVLVIEALALSRAVKMAKNNESRKLAESHLKKGW